MSPEKNRYVLEQFWAAMNTNNFKFAGTWLHDNYVLDWPQSGEHIRGRDNFVLINENYPSGGRWQFAIERLVADENGVATDVTVTDGLTKARVVTFSQLK